MLDELRRRAADAWAFRAQVEREAALRFARLALGIRSIDPDSPVPSMMQSAAADEDRHAILCARLAVWYGHEPATGSSEETPDVEIAPAELPLREALLYEVVAACCITETESVATLTALLAGPAEGEVKDVLHEIARDEVLHGRMGWAHLSREAPGGVAFLAAWIPVMLAGTVGDDLFAPPPAPEPPEADLLRHGVLPLARKREIFVNTLEDVVFPGLEMFGVDPRPAQAWLAGRRA
jgi:hypothetical protein